MVKLKATKLFVAKRKIKEVNKKMMKCCFCQNFMPPASIPKHRRVKHKQENFNLTKETFNIRTGKCACGITCDLSVMSVKPFNLYQQKRLDKFAFILKTTPITVCEQIESWAKSNDVRYFSADMYKHACDDCHEFLLEKILNVYSAELEIECEGQKCINGAVKLSSPISSKRPSTHVKCYSICRT
jgi:hypothetical protein